MWEKAITGKSIFGRFVATFLIIMIPIYILGIYIYNWGMNTIKIEISNSTIAQVSSYLDRLENDVERIKLLQYDVLSDEYLNRLATRWDLMSVYERVVCIKELKDRLLNVRNTSAYITNVSAHILPIEKTISSNFSITSIDMDKYLNVRVPEGVSGAQLMLYNNDLYLSSLHQGRYRFDPLFMVEVELNQNTFQDALSLFNTYEGSGSILINRLDNSMIENHTDPKNIIPTETIVQGLDLNQGSGMVLKQIGQKKYYVVYATSSYLNMTLLKYVPEGYILEPLNNFYIWVWVFSFVAIGIIVIYAVSTYRMLHKPMLELVRSFRKLENGDLKVQIEKHSDSEFGYLFGRFNDMVKNLNMLIEQVYNGKILMQHAELKHLQSQIKPHFLYNSLFMINTMAANGDDNLIPLTKHLGEYFRFMTRNAQDNIPLEEEVKHARVYTDIQAMRFSKRLQIRFEECPEAYRSLRVPRLILQPIIENAFEHGIERKMSGGLLSVSFQPIGTVLSIVIEDNGGSITQDKLEDMIKKLNSHDEGMEVTGIINIHRRLRFIYGEQYGLELAVSDGLGLRVTLKIPTTGGAGVVQIADS